MVVAPHPNQAIECDRVRHATCSVSSNRTTKAAQRPHCECKQKSSPNLASTVC